MKFLILLFPSLVFAGNWATVPDNGWTYASEEICLEANPASKCWNLESGGRILDKELMAIHTETIQECSGGVVCEPDDKECVAVEPVCKDVEISFIKEDERLKSEKESRIKAEADAREAETVRSKELLEKLKASASTETKEIIELLEKSGAVSEKKAARDERPTFGEIRGGN